MRTLKFNDINLSIDNSLIIRVEKDKKTYKFKDSGFIKFSNDDSLYFSDAKTKKFENFESKDKIGLKIYLSDFIGFDSNISLEIYIEKYSERLYFNLDFENETINNWDAIYWPSGIEFSEDEKSYSVMPIQQGQIIPLYWKNEVTSLHFDGQFATSSAYMPWFGRISEYGCYICIAETYWDGAYQINHPANGPTKDLSLRWLPSLGNLSYKRVCFFEFFSQKEDYNDLAKSYRKYLIENGNFTSLEDKIKKNPHIKNLIGASIVHASIKSHVVEGSIFYDYENPENNDSLVTFKERKEQIQNFIDKGANKIYLHLDGWGQAGYDNQHPDYLPACKEAGGWKGLKEITDFMQEKNMLIGLHDQYRDYYYDAKTFDIDKAVTNIDGSHPEFTRWAGGHQTYLCSHFAPYYVDRNFKEIFAHNIKPDCSYLDVFTCNEADECAHPLHRVTRKESLENRLKCFEYLNRHNIIPSSEEACDWSMKELVFCHYAPYSFMLDKPSSPRKGIGVPLFNLVYHDAFMIPWMMEEKTNDHEDFMLYALLNAGMPYLDRGYAYQNIDGGFDEKSNDDSAIIKSIERSNFVAEVQEKLAFLEMTNHKILDGDGMIQETSFSDGSTIHINLLDSTFKIKYGNKKEQIS